MQPKAYALVHPKHAFLIIFQILVAEYKYIAIVKKTYFNDSLSDMTQHINNYNMEIRFLEVFFSFIFYVSSNVDAGSFFVPLPSSKLWRLTRPRIAGGEERRKGKSKDHF